MSDPHDHEARAASFGAVAREYEAARPGYPTEAARFLTEASPCDVLELGAGTGKLTQQVVALGHRVIATDPSRDMLKVLRKQASGAHACVGVAEQIALPRACVDVVVAAQSFHWFATDDAMQEMARVLRPGGALSLVWNTPDFKVPWVRRLFGLIEQGPADLDDPVEDSEVFDLEETRDFRHWQLLHRDSIQTFLASTSYVATRPEAERADLLAQAAAIYDDYGRGPDGMLLPWHARCFRARVSVDMDRREREERRRRPAPSRERMGSTEPEDLLIDFL